MRSSGTLRKNACDKETTHVPTTLFSSLAEGEKKVDTSNLLPRKKTELTGIVVVEMPN